MPYDIERQMKDRKRSCFMCRLSPENILMLACDDSICLQCAYSALKDSQLRENPRQQIEFRCKRCNEITHFDRDLIKQIETSIRSQKRTKKDESFIQKMKKQYLGDQNRQAKAESNYSIQKDYVNKELHTTPKQATTTDNSQKSFHTMLNNFPIKERLLSSKLQSRYSIQNQQRQPQTVDQQQQQQSSPQFSSTPPPQPTTRCRSHSYYQLLYYCLQCQQIVCSQCLLRGKHKNHNNSSITQILSHSLPQFINRTSQMLLSQITRIQTIKDTKYVQLNKKLTEIKTIRENALNYFTQVKQNIEKQQDQVLQRCDLLLSNLLNEQKQIQNQQKEVQQKLACHIRQIKSLKASYKRFLEQQQQQQRVSSVKQKSRVNNSALITNKQHQKLLIEKFANCSQSINNMFNDNERRMSNSKNDHLKEQQIKNSNSNSNEFENESMMLNRHIEQSIKSIRDSLVLPAIPCTRQFMASNNILVNNQKQQQTEQQKKQQQLLVKTYHHSKPPKSSYISYLSTDNNSPNNKTTTTNSNFIKKQQRSLSISPYKVPQASFYSSNNTSNNNNNNQTKINRSKRHSFTKQVNNDIQKQNISWQIRNNNKHLQQKQNLAKTTKLTSQASNLNVSSKKKPTIQQQQKNNSIISKSKNNSITKKKHPKITSNNPIGKFQI